ncbi:MAG: DUF1800 domain-containing protein [Lysobacteraceae bacterium]|nr:MAG: DUF1800 domain-containing protein [Xanthomonadaceae bacterium]
MPRFLSTSRLFSSLRQRKSVYDAIARRHGVRGPLRFQSAAPREADAEPVAVQAPVANGGTSVQAPAMSRSSSPDLLTLNRAPFAVRVLNHLTYGVTPELISAFNALGSNDTARLTAFVDQQLNHAAIDDGALDTRLSSAGYTTLNKSLTQLWADHVAPDPAWEVRMLPAFEVQRATLVRAVYSKRQLREVMVGFWHDHFSVQGTDFSSGPVFVHYNRDVMRANAFGNFRTLLEAMAQSTSMMYFLDNASNTRSGPNENFARELLELHTLGAENYLGFMDPFEVPPCPEDPSYPIGYTDVDVYETASAFTGWSVKDGHWQYPTEDDGNFVYRQAWHDAGPKFVLGKFLNPEQPAMKDGRDILDRLASHPRTAKFICKKLIRRFVSDRPDPALVDSAAAIFRQNWQHPDQIKLTLRHILLSNAFIHSWGQKNRRPFELVAAMLRAIGADWTARMGNSKSDELFWLLSMTGHSPHEWPSPNGYPDTGVAWSGSTSYAMTWRLLNWLTETTDNSVPLAPILALSRANVAQWTANNLVDYWCQRLLGYLPSTARRQILVSFMAQNGNAASYVITDTDAWSVSDLKQHYNHQRLRSMVSLILMSPEFMSR